MTARTTRTPQGDMNLEVARLMEQCKRAYFAAVDAGNSDLAHALRDMGQEIQALMKQLAEEQQAVTA